MTDHAHELRRYARKIAHPAGDVPSVMRAAADEIERLQSMIYALRAENAAHKAALEGWWQKAEWVQQGINDGSIPPTHLGWHLADAMADMLKPAEREYRARGDA